MYRRAMAVVPESGKYVCATVQEDGQMRVRVVEDWKKELLDEEKEVSFRVLVLPEVDESLVEKPYFIWGHKWTSFDQNYWLQYFQMAVKRGLELPSLLLRDLDFMVKCLKSKKSRDWGAISLSTSPKFSKLFAVLLGFKALTELRKNKFPGISVEMEEQVRA